MLASRGGLKADRPVPAADAGQLTPSAKSQARSDPRSPSARAACRSVPGPRRSGWSEDAAHAGAERHADARRGIDAVDIRRMADVPDPALQRGLGATEDEAAVDPAGRERVGLVVEGQDAAVRRNRRRTSPP